MGLPLIVSLVVVEPFFMKQAGLVGARDATNVLRSTELAASVITSIGEEHLAALGGSLESIAMAKSGIIKHGRPVGYFSPPLLLWHNVWSLWLQVTLCFLTVLLSLRLSFLADLMEHLILCSFQSWHILLLSYILSEVPQIRTWFQMTHSLFCQWQCHAPLPKILGNRVATRVGDVYTRGKYPTYTR